MSSESANYVGRFAPSPTGPLHFGSLLAAVASYLQARANNGRWLLRIENIDPPRADPEAIPLILEALEAFGFEWDGPVTYQSQFADRHYALVEQLLKQGQAYPCTCSRRTLASARRGPLGIVYPGTCRSGCLDGESAIRIRTNNDAVCFTDGLQGRQCQRLESETGDFVIRRRDGLLAYHLAVAVDDVDQGITEVVRGIDLMDSTPRQIFIQRSLGMRSPAYMHIPVATGKNGQKLSKSYGAAPVKTDPEANRLYAALQALRQDPPDVLKSAATPEIWNWAFNEWDIGPLRALTEVPADQFNFG